jgi:glycogen debranching enzyme
VHYPVSCSPQAWAAGAPFLLLQAVLGLEADAPAGKLTIRNPLLPAFLDTLDLRALRVGNARIDLRFTRSGSRTHADVMACEGEPIRVSIELE